MTSADPKTADSKPGAKPRRRWLQFTVRGLIVLTFLVAMGISWLRKEAIRAREQRLAVEQALELHARLDFKDAGPDWLKSVIGEDLFVKVDSVETEHLGTIDADMTWLAALDDLQVLTLKYSTSTWPRSAMGDASVAHVADMRELRRLSLPRFDLTDRGAIALEVHPEMTYLKLPETLITDDGLAHIRHMHKLWHLDLSGLPGVTDAGLVHLQDMNNLRWLYLSQTSVTGPGLEHLRGMNSLQSLFLAETPLMDEGIAHIGQLKSLRELNLSSTRITDAGLAQLGDMPNLGRLELEGTLITDSAFKHLAGCPNLEFLSYDSQMITGDGLADLAALPNIQQLFLSDANLNENGWQALAQLKQVQAVYLDGAQVTDEELKKLVEAMPQLITLDLAETHVTDAGVACISQMPSLLLLDLRGTKVTDACLPALACCASLESVSLTNTAVTSDAVIQFANSLQGRAMAVSWDEGDIGNPRIGASIMRAAPLKGQDENNTTIQ